MSQFNFSNLTRDNMLSPQFYRQVADGLTNQVADLRSRYKPYQETYQEPHHSFFGGLFGRKTTRTRTAYPTGYQQAMADATGFENQALYYKALADYIEANPDVGPSEADLAAMDPNGPDIDRSTLTIPAAPMSENRSPTINPLGVAGAGLRIPYGT